MDNESKKMPRRKKWSKTEKLVIKTFLVFLVGYLVLFAGRFAVFYFGLEPHDGSHYLYMTDEQKKEHSSPEHYEAWKDKVSKQGEEK